MLKKLLVTAALLLPLQASAGFISDQRVLDIYGSNIIYFGISHPDQETLCSNWGRHFNFDATTEKGKNLLTLLMSAYLSDKRVNVWYNESTLPGTTEQNGCSSGKLAVVEKIGFRDYKD